MLAGVPKDKRVSVASSMIRVALDLINSSSRSTLPHASATAFLGWIRTSLHEDANLPVLSGLLEVLLEVVPRNSTNPKPAADEAGVKKAAELMEAALEAFFHEEEDEEEESRSDFKARLEAAEGDAWRMVDPLIKWDTVDAHKTELLRQLSVKHGRVLTFHLWMRRHLRANPLSEETLVKQIVSSLVIMPLR